MIKEMLIHKKNIQKLNNIILSKIKHKPLLTLI